jgi:hypothetical protein
MRLIVVAAVFAAGAFASGAAEAAYAAIAFSKASGASGYSYSEPSRAAAEERALQECGPGCGVVIWTHDACAALAVGQGNGYGTYWSTSKTLAGNGALSQCAARTSGCRVTAYTCSG